MLPVELGLFSNMLLLRSEFLRNFCSIGFRILRHTQWMYTCLEIFGNQVFDVSVFEQLSQAPATLLIFR